MPWSKQKRVARQKITEKQAKAILERAAKHVKDLNKMRAGCLYAPAPPPPPPADAMDQPANQPPRLSDQERQDALREEKLGQILSKELEEADDHWVDYEQEDTQAKLDLADMVLDDMIGELTEFLASKL